ncbi:OmpA family protein [Paracidovorax wautersii]|uniref:Outer membrane protein OmpA-like peptidoglycan-associated protein n=1 Tax=Paracidovorax wautersii TaxID=1177982 RepID=A0ABU1IEI9_9BURK|nr:OmpA family protein [Paracidovorax wautersii]MDR6215628.1 outer membrane protein OmpA-like peptidoglycan-associated protein [Paracidovorax wautersii]
MSFSSSDDDSQQRFALGFLFALIALVVSTVVGVTVYKQRAAARAPVVEPAAVVVAPAGTLVVAEDEVARIVVDGGVVRFYFATGRADLAPGAEPALADLARAVAEGRSVVVSGFHDATGDAVANAELAKNRALAVRDALKAAGVPDDKIELRKPEVTQAGGNNAEARRVEVTLASQ